MANLKNAKKNTKKSKINSEIVKKTLKLWFWSILHLGRWYIPNIPEIKPEELYEQIKYNNSPLLIDIRDDSEIKKFGYIENTQRFPYFNFPSYLDKIPSDHNTEIVTICPGGGASLVVAEILISKGYKNVRSLKGGVKSWYKKKFPLIPFEEGNFQPINKETEELDSYLKDKKGKATDSYEISISLDVRNESCPLPVLKTKKAMKGMDNGEILEVLATDPGSLRDIPAWAINTKQEILSYYVTDGTYRYLIRKLH